MPKHEIYDAINSVIRVVDRKGRDMDERWGVNRLQTLVPIEWAEKFRRQNLAFSKTIFEEDLAATTKQGEAMLRAYAKLDELAVEAGHKPGAPDQWEFEAGGQLVILVRDMARVGQVDTGGRKAQTWSLDEIANVITAHAELMAVKDAFPGAVLESMRPNIPKLQDDEDVGF